MTSDRGWHDHSMLERVVWRSSLHFFRTDSLLCLGLQACVLHEVCAQTSFANMVKHKVDEDTKKINYVKAALLGADRFVLSSALDVDLHAALEWIADRHPTQVCARALGRLWRLFLLIGLVLRQRLSVQRPSVGSRSWPTVLCRAANATIGSQALIRLLPGHVRQGIVTVACVCACMFCCRHRAA